MSNLTGFEFGALKRGKIFAAKLQNPENNKLNGLNLTGFEFGALKRGKIFAAKLQNPEQEKPGWRNWQTRMT